MFDFVLVVEVVVWLEVVVVVVIGVVFGIGIGMVKVFLEEFDGGWVVV